MELRDFEIKKAMAELVAHARSMRQMPLQGYGRPKGGTTRSHTSRKAARLRKHRRQIARASRKRNRRK